MTMTIRRRIVGTAAICAIAVAGEFIYRHERPVAVAQGLSPFAVIRQPRQQVPVLFNAPTFDFVDQEGRRTKNSELHGRIWIADFIFTHCAGQCPKVTAKFVELQKSIVDPEIRFVTFSVDPDHDDPKTLKDYAAAHNTTEARWLLLRPPDRQTIQHVAQKMVAMTRSSDAGDTIVHTDFLVLIDADGRVRGLYDTKDARMMGQLQTDAATLAREKLLDKAPRIDTVRPNAD